MFASQSRTIISSSVAAGEVIQLKPTVLIPALSISPKNPATLLLDEKYAKKSGLCQWVTPGNIFACTSAITEQKKKISYNNWNSMALIRMSLLYFKFLIK